jgi:hypothetical protein
MTWIHRCQTARAIARSSAETWALASGRPPLVRMTNAWTDAGACASGEVITVTGASSVGIMKVVVEP